jgi:hypothetical protein
MFFPSPDVFTKHNRRAGVARPIFRMAMSWRKKTDQWERIASRDI